VKKTLIALIAVPALTLVACGETNTANNAADLNTEATANEAVEDLGNAQNDSENAAENALDDAANLAEDAGEAIENVAEDAGNAVEDATN